MTPTHHHTQAAPNAPLYFCPRSHLRWRHRLSGITYKRWRDDLSQVLSNRPVEVIVDELNPTGRVVCVWKKDLSNPEIYEICAAPGAREAMVQEVMERR